MNWSTHHTQAENFAAQADLAVRGHDEPRARLLYEAAAAAEEQALKALDPHKLRTLAITAVSAAALWYKAGRFKAAEQVAYQGLAIRQLPEFAREQLRDLLQACWHEGERQESGVRFAAGQVFVSIKGGDIVRGGAPLELIIDKVQNVQSMYYRTTEFLKGAPHRKHGPPPDDVRKTCRPWLFQAPASSYQFAVAVELPQQLDFLAVQDVSPIDVATKFLDIVRAAIVDPVHELAVVVPDLDYRRTFMKLTRSLAPTGKSYDALEIRAIDQNTPLRLSTSTREQLTEIIRKERPKTEPPGQMEIALHGILRAVHLENDWLEVDVGGGTLQHVDNVGDAVDDTIGPLVNRAVIIRVAHVKDRYRFLDIELDD